MSGNTVVDAPFLAAASGKHGVVLVEVHQGVVDMEGLFDIIR